MKMNLYKKPAIFVGLALFFLLVFSSFSILAGEWLIAKINIAANNYFKIGSVNGMRLNRGYEREIALSQDEHIEMLTAINDSAYSVLSYKLQGYVAADGFGYDYSSTPANAGGRLVLIPYDLEYQGGDYSVDAYVRLKPSSAFANEVIINGQTVICYQGLFSLDTGFPASLDRIGFASEAVYSYYYPKPLQKGDAVRLVYALYFPDGTISAALSDLDLQLEATYAKNNYTAMNWNMRFNGNIAEPFDYSKTSSIPYAYYYADVNALLYVPPDVADKTGDTSDEEIDEDDNPNEGSNEEQPNTDGNIPSESDTPSSEPSGESGEAPSTSSDSSSEE